MSYPSEPSVEIPLATRRRRRGTGRVTLADVARLAEVSAQTVSRVLNTPESVPPATLARVRHAIAEAGYVPDRLAGALASGRSRLVAALVPTIGGPVFLETLQSLSQTLGQRGYQLMLGESGYNDADEVQLLENLISRRPDGIVLTRIVQSPMARARLKATGIPVVETWDLTSEPVDMLIGFSHGAVGAQVADFIAGLGRRRPSLVTGDDPRAGQRRRTYAERLAVLGLLDGDAASLPVEQAAAPVTLGAARAAAVRLLDAHPGTDAVFCSTDLAAWGVVTEARERGLRVPDDVAVVGFGDLGFARDLAPALTTIRIDGTAIGEQAARWIMDRAEGHQPAVRTRDIGFTLVRRDSA
ncbi:LacI family DNA-binding transcriptional regulator [Pseudorhodoferax sp.]|uniref:LacI family DNA-binding transcriptional regulator n=1 Tax=Pseudorhodoferax sp. TaxID=1993553 RepID=UPI0039E5F359